MFDLGSILKGGTEGLFGGVAEVVKTFKADPTEVLKLEMAFKQAQLNVELALSQAQNKVNEIEAGSQSYLASGWRPAAGWVCVSGLAYEDLVRPLMQSVVNFWYPNYTMVSLDMEGMMSILFGMLGFGIYRTYEKVNKSVPVV